MEKVLFLKLRGCLFPFLGVGKWVRTAPFLCFGEVWCPSPDRRRQPWRTWAKEGGWVSSWGYLQPQSLVCPGHKARLASNKSYRNFGCGRSFRPQSGRGARWAFEGGARDVPGEAGGGPGRALDPLPARQALSWRRSPCVDASCQGCF